MMLVDVHSLRHTGYAPLWDLLSEREPEQSISHKAMPSWDAHCHFVQSKPYLAWYLIRVGDEWAGSVYMTRQHEIGIGVMQRHRHRGIATWAIEEVLRLHPGRALANINPANQPSIDLFRKVGFTGPIQITLERAA